MTCPSTFPFFSLIFHLVYGYFLQSPEKSHGSTAPRLHGSEPEENFPLYVVFEEGFEICIDNPVSAKFSYYATSTVKGISHLQLKLPRHTHCRVQNLKLALIVLTFMTRKVYDEDLTAGGRLGIFLDSDLL